MATDLNTKVYVASHRGMVGSAIVRNLEAKGFTNMVNSTTKCNFEQLGKEAKDVLVSKASRPASQSSHDLSTP